MQTVHPTGRQTASALHHGHAGCRTRQVYVISAEGGTPEPVLPEATNQEQPSWSPDGHIIAGELRLLFGISASGHQDCGFENARGQATARSEGLMGGLMVARRPITSPPVRWTPRNQAVRTFKRRNGHTREKRRRLFVLVQNDGRFVYFKRSAADLQLWRVRVRGSQGRAGGELDEYQVHGVLRAAFGLGLAPDNSPLLVARYRHQRRFTPSTGRRRS